MLRQVIVHSLELKMIRLNSLSLWQMHATFRSHHSPNLKIDLEMGIEVLPSRPRTLLGYCKGDGAVPVSEESSIWPRASIAPTPRDVPMEEEEMINHLAKRLIQSHQIPNLRC
jgi:hypothetical protein